MLINTATCGRSVYKLINFARVLKWCYKNKILPGNIELSLDLVPLALSF